MFKRLLARLCSIFSLSAKPPADKLLQYYELNGFTFEAVGGSVTARHRDGQRETFVGPTALVDAYEWADIEIEFIRAV